MLSGFKNFYSKSVDLIKQVQDQVAVKGQASTPVPTVAPEDTHPGFHLVDRWLPAPRTRAYNSSSARVRTDKLYGMRRATIQADYSGVICFGPWCMHEQVRAQVGRGPPECGRSVEQGFGESQPAPVFPLLLVPLAALFLGNFSARYGARVRVCRPRMQT